MVGKKRRQLVPRGVVPVLAALAVVSVACSGAEAPTDRPGPASPSVEIEGPSSTPSVGTSSEPIVGEWERMLQCEELVPPPRKQDSTTTCRAWSGARSSGPRSPR